MNGRACGTHVPERSVITDKVLSCCITSGFRLSVSRISGEWECYGVRQKLVGRVGVRGREGCRTWEEVSPDPGATGVQLRVCFFYNR